MEKEDRNGMDAMEFPGILFIADEPDKGLWDFFDASKLEGIDLIISCGDLPPQYLSFLATYFPISHMITSNTLSEE